MEQRLGSIYIIENSINNKVYIGQTINTIKKRLQEHISKAINNKKDMYLYRAIRKYGKENFSIRELEKCTVDIITEREKYYIKFYNSINNGYNTALASDSYYLSRVHLDIEDIKKLYLKEFKSLKEISQIYNVGRYVITQELLKAGVQIRVKSKTSKLKNSFRYKEIPNMVLNGISLRSIAKQICCSYSSVRDYCIENNIEYNSSKSARRRDDENIC